MYEVIKSILLRGRYDLDTTLKRIDTYHLEGKLSDSQRDELKDMARNGEKTIPFDIQQEISLIWAAIRALQSGSAGGESLPEDDVQDYKAPTGAHDAYYAGDRVAWKGVTYICTAPDGVACVWDPDVMPNYWSVMDA